MRLDRFLARLRKVPARELPARVRAGVAARLEPVGWTASAGPGPAPRWPVGPLPATTAEPLPSLDGWSGPWSGGRSAALDLLGADDDPRARWEVARLQVHARRSAHGDRAATEQIVRFCARNPPGLGLAWASAAEVAHRLVSLVAAGDPRLRDAVASHAAWLLGHPTLPSSAYNHRIAELSALAVAAVALPELPAAQRWSAEARTLPEVLTRQLHPDGLGVEQAPAYLAQVLAWGALARGCGVSGLERDLRRGGEALSELLDDAGELPALGDDDGGRVLTVDPVAPHGQAVVRLLEATLHTTFPPPAPHTFPDAGVTVLRGPGIRVVVDHGPLGGPPLGAHGHADALAVWVSVDGRPVLGGRGTGRYVGDPGRRRFVRGTSSHATVVVDGADQSVQHDHPFLWRTMARAWSVHTDPAGGTVSAAHDGYRSRRGVDHHRTVRLQGSRLVLEDRLVGSGRHHVAVVLPFAPGVDLRVDADPRCRVVDRPDDHAPRYGAPTVPALTRCLEAVVAPGEVVRTVVHLRR